MNKERRMIIIMKNLNVKEKRNKLRNMISFRAAFREFMTRDNRILTPEE